MAVEIREATMDDVDAIVEMAQRFYPESPYPHFYGDMPVSQAAGLVIVTLQGMTEYGIKPGVMLVADDNGKLAGMVCMHIDAATFTPAVIASEIVWWVEPEYRSGTTAVRILKAAEAAAKERGATVVRMAALSTSPEQAGQIYERLGFVQTEVYYTKRVV